VKEKARKNYHSAEKKEKKNVFIVKRIHQKSPSG
jgi:hypothetical protein